MLTTVLGLVLPLRRQLPPSSNLTGFGRNSLAPTQDGSVKLSEDSSLRCHDRRAQSDLRKLHQRSGGDRNVLPITGSRWNLLGFNSGAGPA